MCRWGTSEDEDGGYPWTFVLGIGWSLVLTFGEGVRGRLRTRMETDLAFWFQLKELLRRKVKLLFLALAHSKNELMQWRGVRRLSVNFCANRFFSHTNGRIATKLSQDGLQVSVHPGVLKVKVTWYAHFLGFLEWATPSLTVWFIIWSMRTTMSLMGY